MAKTAKKTLLAVLGFVFALFLLLSVTACNSGTKTVTLTFDANGGTAVEAITAKPGDEVTLPSTEREGYAFEGWYESSEFEGAALESPFTAPESDTTYYAKWAALPAITLELDGGALENGKTTLYLAAGENLYAFMQNYIPTKEGHEFGAWLVGEDELASTATMPEEGITLKAAWKIGYTVEIYKQNTALGTALADYELDEALTVTGYAYAGTELTATEELEHFTLNSELTSSVLLSEESTVLKAYYDRDVYEVVFLANAPEEGVSGSTLSVSAAYEAEVALPANGFSISGYRFIGWAIAANDSVEYLPGDVITLERSFILYAIWDGNRYTDALGGTDYIFRSPNEGDGLVYLQRKGLPEQEGSIDENNCFEFTAKDFTLKGKLNEAKNTFSYLLEDMVGEYVFLNSYLGSLNYEIGFALEAYDGASISFYNTHFEEEVIGDKTYTKQVRDELILEIGGTYALSDESWGYPIYTFTADAQISGEYADYATFSFRLGAGTLISGEVVKYFEIQGQEALNGSDGQYLTLNGNMFSYPIWVLDGFGACVIYLNADSAPIINHGYTPASYWNTHLDAGDDEFALWYNDAYYGMTLDIVVRIRTERGYNANNEQITVGVWEWQDDLFGDYDYTYETEDGATVTERYYLDGYGAVTYFGVVTTDEEGNETFSKELKGTYEMHYSIFYNGSYYEDDDGSGDYSFSTFQYNALHITYENGTSVRMNISSTPGYTLGGEWANGVMNALNPMAGGYALENPKTLSYSMNGTRYLTPQTVYITGVSNNIELWGYTGYVYTKNSVAYPLSRLIFSGTFEFKETKNGYDIYTITVVTSNFTAATAYPRNSTVDFFITEEGTIVFLADEQTFEAADGGVFTIDGFNNATYTKDGETVDASYQLLSVGSGITAYYFESANAGGIFFKFTDNTVHELTNIYSEIDYQRSNAWNKSTIRSSAYNVGTLYLFADDKALVYVANLNSATVYYIIGSVSAGDVEGEYKFARSSGGSLTAYNSFTFKYASEDEFVIRSQYYYFTLDKNEDGSKLVSDGYGNATYTDADGKEYTGTLELLFETYNGAINPETMAFVSSYNENLYLLTANDGTRWGFTVKRTNSSAGTSANLTTFTVVDANEKLFGVWWEDDNGAIGTTMYISNGVVFYVWGYSSSSLSSVATAGVWTATENVKAIAETEYEYDYTYQLNNRNGVLQDTVYKVAFLHLVANDGITEWNVLFTYDETISFDYDIVNDDGEVIGNIYGNGYYGQTYTDAEGNKFDMNVDSNDENGVAIRYRDEKNNIYRLYFDLIEKDGKTVAWLRTAPAFTAYAAPRQLRDLNVYLVTDGHGGATLWTDAANGTCFEGTIEDLGNDAYRFTSGELVLEFNLYANVASDGSFYFYFYLVYQAEYTGFFYDEDTMTTLWLDGYHSATYIDSYGKQYTGNFNVLGANKSVLEFTSKSLGNVYFTFTYAEDGTPNAVLTPVAGDFAYEDNVVLGYQGGAVASALPAGVDTIARSAFYGNTVLKSLDLTGIKTVEEYAFYGAAALTTITGAESIEYIGKYGFYECRSLTSVDFSGVKLVEEYGLGMLLSLKELNLASIEELGDYALYYAQGLTRVDLGANLKHFGKQTFFNVRAFASDGGAVNVYLHTTADTDYNALVGENNQIFYQCEMKLYVDSLDVVKAIYNSKMATEYRTTSYYEQYWQLLRIAGEEKSEYGFYVIANFTDFSSSATWMIRLDGMLTDGGVTGAKTYKYYAYERNGNTLDLVYYDTTKEGNYGTATATLNEDGSLLTFDNITWAKLSTSEPLLYENKDGSTFEVLGQGDMNNSTGAFSLKDMKGKLTFADGAVIEGTMTRTNPSGSTRGYLQLSVSSKYTVRINLNADKTFEMPYALLYYVDAQTGGNQIQILTQNGTTKINSVSASLSYTSPAGQYYSLSGASTAGNRADVDGGFDVENLKYSFILTYGTSSETTRYRVDVTFDHSSITYVAVISVIFGNERWTLTKENGGLVDDPQFDALNVHLTLDNRFGTTEVTGIYTENANPGARLIGSDSFLTFNQKGAVKNADGSFTLYLGDDGSTRSLYSTYKLVYTPATETEGAKLVATCIEHSVALVNDTQTVIFTVDNATGEATNVVALKAGTTVNYVVGSVKLATNKFSVVVTSTASLASTSNKFTQYTIEYKTDSYTIETTATDLKTTGTGTGNDTLSVDGSTRANFVLDEEGNAVGLVYFGIRYTNNGASSLSGATYMRVFAGEKANEFYVMAVYSNKGMAYKIVYTPGANGARGTYTSELLRTVKTFETTDGLYRVSFTTDAQGNLLGINLFHYRTSNTVTTNYNSAYGAGLLDATREGNVWTLTYSNVKYTITYDSASDTVTVTK